MRILNEAIDKLSFAIIEIEIPQDSEVETTIRIHGTDEAMMKGGQETILPVGTKCDMCGVVSGMGVGRIKVGDAIDNRIESIRQESPRSGAESRMSRQVESQINWLTNAKNRLTKTGEINKEIPCPRCFSWRWVGIQQYEAPKSIVKKAKPPWAMFMDWLWATLEAEGLEPFQQSGFETRPKEMVQDKYGLTQQSGEWIIEKGQRKFKSRGVCKEVEINVNSLGKSKKKAHRKLSRILVKHAKEIPQFHIDVWPNEKQEDKLEMALAAASDEASESELRELENLEQDVNVSRAIYISGMVEDVRFGEESALEPYPIRGVDFTKLMDKLRSDVDPGKSSEMPIGIGGEWGEAVSAIKGASAATRSERASKAYETFKTTPEYAELAKKKEAKLRKPDSTVFPGPKFKYWDESIRNIADEIDKTPAEVETAIVKYLIDVRGFPKPFSFNRLPHDDAVKALHIVNAIKPTDIGMVAESIIRAINGKSVEFKMRPLETGINRTNILIKELREHEKAIQRLKTDNPLLAENHIYGRLIMKKEAIIKNLRGNNGNI